MSETANSPILTAALTASQPAPAAPAVAAVEVAPAAPAAPAVEAPKPPAEAAPAPTLNPWALRPPKPAASPAPSPAIDAAASPAAPPAPVADPALAALEARVASLSSVLTRQANAELAGVPENVRAYVASLAGNDAAKQLDAIHTLRANGLLPTAPALVPAGATTMPAAAPSVPAAPSSPDAPVLAEYERLSSKSPIIAAAFRTANGAAIARAEAARASRN
jgi:hypothetical protein